MAYFAYLKIRPLVRSVPGFNEGPVACYLLSVLFLQVERCSKGRRDKLTDQ